MVLEEAIRRFLEVKKAQVRSERTVETYEEILRRWREGLEAGLMADQIRPEHIRPYVHDQIFSGSTRHERYRQVRIFLNGVGENGLIPGERLNREEPP